MPTLSYEELLRETRPQVIESWEQYEAIGHRAGDLVGKGRARTPDETKLMRLLLVLIEDYDRRHGMPPDNSTPAEYLQFLVEHSGKSATELLLPVFGQRSHVSEEIGRASCRERV